MRKLSFLTFLRRYLLFIVLTGLMGTVFSFFAVRWAVVPIYQARTSLLILPAQQSGNLSPMLSQLESQLEYLGPLQSVLSGKRFNSSLKDMISILRSRTLAEQVAAEIPLKDLPEVKKEMRKHKKADPHRTLINWLIKQLEIQPPDSKEGTLRLQIKLSDPQLVAKLTNTYIQKLEIYLFQLLGQDSDLHQKYLAKQLSRMGQDLQTIEDEMLRFQKKNRLVSLNDEVKQMITQLAELEAEELTAQSALKESQAKLARLSSQSTELNSNWSEVANQLELSAAGLRERKAEIHRSRQRYERLLSALPLQALELARLERRLALKNQLFVLLSQQQQAAQLEAARQSPLFKILDPALPADEPIFPVMPVVLAISGIISISMGGILSLLHYAANASKELNHAET
ncbi:hypothetical protein COW36_04100 [bacterium (Candidatus Blackallbacteria) CG17_big_fil_post_rev_8_21_14_2_50_48_46]|uniref:Polysaccharide chain length determinant N-terminal domain-containing protein n=1 Tax=bacterium (Candidatus Blackallbacteria) CG17_big_fil_post_rev_8_21_14_2_50_48_46 TaxID=2014261 RepID=A0A2M7G8P4_9BACT|nr:MAG: hypothetical protein COW64_04845 [bacterium (Candidatus Blackallbacteria) CG18_big_fil_WC_8_21_14_2_50_49_26]PIW18480.1 MAG: hypothetical protein COW36_04100 [bacterium (Candidatus Blackallbacteria) CG17_big_fil_post_rev_8_21_14_2_50_48_46]PIW46535.1 MAG: hypothetical protein COW20_16580 [bacterium (Candidatus Blackallbacteria) CG13_big_fil_rev_8_21_14_2_50_49_14]